MGFSTYKMEIWLSVVTVEMVGWAGRVRSLIGRVAAVLKD